MDNVLASIVNVNKTTSKELTEQTKLLERIAARQDQIAIIDKKRLDQEKRDARAAKRKGGDRNILKNMGGPGKTTQKEKKGMFDWLKGLLGGIFSSGGLMKILGALGIGTAIYQYLNNERFRNFLNNNLLIPIKNAVMTGLFGENGLFGSKNQARAWEWIKKNPLATLGLAAAGLAKVIGPAGLIKTFSALASSAFFLKGALIAAGLAAASKGFNSARTGIANQRYGVGTTAQGAQFGSQDITAFRTQQEKELKEQKKYFKRNKAGKIIYSGPSGTPQLTEEAASMRGRYFAVTDAMAERKTLNDEVYRMQERLERLREQDTGGDDPMSVGARNKIPGLEEEIEKKRAKLNSQAKRITQLYEKLGVTTEELIQLQISEGRRDINTLKNPDAYSGRNPLGHLYHGYTFNQYNDPFTQGYQTGGPIRVPGHSNGDRHPFLLPEGSFIMNKNAVSMLQTGGMVPTLLESGENIYGPGQWDHSHVMMNNLFSRFSEGGKVLDLGFGDTTTIPNSKDSTGDGDGEGGPTGAAKHDYLIKLNDKNIVKISSDIGRCVEGSLKTMDASGVPEPAATGGVPGNHPRGGMVQLINDFGWQAPYGKNKMMKGGAYGDAQTKEMTYDDYLNHVENGKIPSGAIIFSTRHSDWNGTSHNSRGYDMAIAQKNGMNLWNGQHYDRPYIYGNTQKVVALTPGGEAAEGLELGGDYSGGGGGGNNFMQTVVHPALKMFTDFAKLFLPFGDVLKNVTGGGNGTGSPTGGTGPVDMGADTNAKLMSAAKLAMQAGFSKEEAKIMAAIAGGESTFNNRAHNTNFAGGDNSYGLWQINMLGAMGPERRSMLGLSSNEELFDPATNARAAKLIYDRRGGGENGFKAWGAYTDGNAGKYMNAAQALQLQRGGAVHARGAGSSANRALVSESQKQFAQQIAEASTPVVVPVPMGGGNGGSSPDHSGPDTSFPVLRSEDTSIVSMEYKYRITMGASV